MSRTTSNLGLRVWNNPSDQFSTDDLAHNWDALDADYSRGRPANQAESLATVPSSSNFDGRLVYLTAADSGFPSKTFIRYDGAAWRAVGPLEILAAVPTLGNYAGRMVLLSSAASGFAAWTLIRYDGSSWAQPNRGVDVSATVPVTNNYAGRLVVLSAANGGFNAWDAIRFDGTAWAKIGPASIPPATELNYYAQTTDLTTTNTVAPGDTIVTFGSNVYENVKYYFDIRIPQLRHSVANQGVFFYLREGGVTQQISAFNTQNASTSSTVAALVPFTPTAGTHTYAVTWSIANAGTGSIMATGVSPAIFRIIKA